MRSERPSGLLKIDLDTPGAVPQPGRVSEMILDFAGPLLNLDPHSSLDLRKLRSVMQLAEICWNLPVFEKMRSANFGAFQREFTRILEASPGPVAEILRELVQDRKERFGGIPFLVTVTVNEAGTGDFRVIAEARMPGTRTGRN